MARRISQITRDQVDNPELLRRFLVQLTDSINAMDSSIRRGIDLPREVTEQNVLSGVMSGPAALVQLGVDEIGTKRSNLTATVAPTATDDNSKGYGIGSVWINVAASPTPKVYICAGALTTAAIWIEVCCGGGGGGAGSDLTAPPLSNTFTWRNQGGATVTDSSNIFVGSKKVTGWRISAPTSAGDNLRILEINTPSTPYTITAAFEMMFLNQNFYSGGLCWVSAGGAVVSFDINTTNPNLGSRKWTNVTTFSANYKNINFNIPPQALMWMQITDDGTNRICRFSPDGDAWMVFHSVGRTDFLTPTKVGVFLDTNNGTDPAMLSLVHWVQS